MAGIVAAGGQGAIGVAHDAQIMLIKVLNSVGQGNYADIAKGIRYAADNGMDVINLTLVWSANPYLNALQVEDLLIGTANPYVYQNPLPMMTKGDQ